jgi:hypothetical protein
MFLASAFLSGCQLDRFFVLPLSSWQQLKVLRSGRAFVMPDRSWHSHYGYFALARVRWMMIRHRWKILIRSGPYQRANGTAREQTFSAHPVIDTRNQE